MERTVREFLAAAQQECKVKLDAGRVNPVFKVGTAVTAGPGAAADQGAARRARWDGPFTVTARQSPNA
jgi:hypothetical protein